MEAPDFWDDAEKASADMKELKDLKSIVERADALSMAYDDIMTLIEMGNEEADESLVPEVENEFVQFQKEFEDLRITTMLTGEHDAEMRRENDRLRLCRVTSCRISSKILILKLQMMIFELIRTVRAVPVDSISTKRHRQSELPIFQRVLWYNVRMSVHSI